MGDAMLEGTFTPCSITDERPKDPRPGAHRQAVLAPMMPPSTTAARRERAAPALREAAALTQVGEGRRLEGRVELTHLLGHARPAVLGGPASGLASQPGARLVVGE